MFNDKFFVIMGAILLTVSRVLIITLLAGLFTTLFYPENMYIVANICFILVVLYGLYFANKAFHINYLKNKN